MSTALKVVLTVVVLLIFALLMVFVYLMSKVNKIVKVDTKDVVYLERESEFFETDESAEFETVAPDAIVWDNDKETVAGTDDVTNILLIGQDARPGEGRQRSDTMIIMTLNRTDKTVSLTSIMRDTYVQMPGYSDNRINAAYAFGGMPLLDDTIKTNFDVVIDGNIEVNFSGFEKVIEEVGGVDLTLTSGEASYINQALWDQGISSNLSAGDMHLNGQQALWYARTRAIGNSDFDRTGRQRKVILAVFSKVKQLSLSQMMSLLDTVLPLMTTDMESTELISLAKEVFQMNISEIPTYNIPQDAGFSGANVRGMDVLVPDLAECRKLLQTIIYGE